MAPVAKSKVTIYVNRLSQQWIVCDPEGNFWILPQQEQAWENRRPFQITPDSILEPVPGHYKYLLKLPF
jgi:hypothetical protein